MLAVVHARGYVGTLRPHPEGLEFVYAPQWLRQEHAFPLSPRLTLRDEPWRGNEVLYFFSNLLPEGPLLETLSNLRGLPRRNVYRQLEAFGRECAGAFEIMPAGKEPKKGERAPPKYRKYSREELASDLAQMRDNIPLLSSHSELRLSLAGAQNKVPVRYVEGELWLPEGNAPSTHILKPALQPQKVYVDSVENEAFCLHLAAALGLNVPSTVVLSDPEPVLLIERYDRMESGEKIERLHQLDMCQLAGVLPDHKYESDGGPGFKNCFDQIDVHSAAPAVDRLHLVDRTIFNYLIGNADAHGKNLSMLYTTEGSLRLAPAYDLLATGYWQNLSEKMAMAIGGERRPAWVQARHWLRFCESVGLNPSQLRRRARDLCAKALEKQGEVLAPLNVSKALATHLAATLERNSERIERRLGATT